MPNQKSRYIRASEIGTYVYCRRAWWLKQVAGFEPLDKTKVWAAGEAAHLRHGQQVRRAQNQRRAARVLLLCGLLLLAIGLIFILGVVGR